MIPKAKRQRKNSVSSDIVLDTSERKQDDIPLVIDMIAAPHPELNKNDDTRNKIIRSSGGIKESHEMRFPTKTSTHSLRKRRRVITYVESVCSDDTKNSMDSDIKT